MERYGSFVLWFFAIVGIILIVLYLTGNLGGDAAAMANRIVASDDPTHKGWRIG